MLVLEQVLVFGAVLLICMKKWGGAVVRFLVLALFPAVVIVLVVGAAFALLIAYAGDTSALADGRMRYCGSPLQAFVQTSLPHVAAWGIWSAVLSPALLLLVAVVLEVVANFLRAIYTTSEHARRSLSYAITRGLSFASLLSIVLGGVYAFWLAGPAGSVGAATGTTALPTAIPQWFFFLVWAGLLGFSLQVRSVLVQYVGDVVVYVTSKSLDRFYKSRELVREEIFTSLRRLYAMKVEGAFVYDHVLVAGHSLGSLIAYDSLNRLIAEDEAARTRGGAGLAVLRRTPLLLTFGSPLDKTAFLFARQVTQETRTRAALAATTQPMLIRTELRPTRWVNVWSPWDIVSGPLEYYDPPASANAISDPHIPSGRIENVHDEDATTLLYAHVEYWRNSRIYRVILREIGMILRRRKVG